MVRVYGASDKGTWCEYMVLVTGLWCECMVLVTGLWCERMVRLAGVHGARIIVIRSRPVIVLCRWKDLFVAIFLITMANFKSVFE